MKSRSCGKTFSEINAIPLIDVLLVLLVIFMVTAPLYLQEIQLDLPIVDHTASYAEPTEHDTTLFIKHNGEMYINTKNQKPLSLKEVVTTIQSTATKQHASVYIHADKNCSYGTVIKTLAALEQSGITQFHLVNSTEQTI